MKLTRKEIMEQVIIDFNILRNANPKHGTKKNKSFFKGVLRFARYEFSLTKKESARGVLFWSVQNRIVREDIDKFHSSEKKQSSIYKFIKNVKKKR
jgi:hypothetical protein